MNSVQNIYIYKGNFRIDDVRSLAKLLLKLMTSVCRGLVLIMSAVIADV